VNKVREMLFVKSSAPETLPSTLFHIQRAHYQTAVWRQANEQYPDQIYLNLRRWDGGWKVHQCQRWCPYPSPRLVYGIDHL